MNLKPRYVSKSGKKEKELPELVYEKHNDTEWDNLCFLEAILTIYTLTSVKVSPHCSPYIPQSADKENLCNNQQLLLLLIIVFILMILLHDSGVIL